VHLAHDDGRRELADAVTRLVRRRADVVGLRAAVASGRGYDDVLWTTLCEQIGAAALAVPEEDGGAGFTLLETLLVLERLGAGLTPTPLLGSGVLATQAVLATAAPPDRARLLPALSAGTSVAALAWADNRGRWRTDGSDVRATATDDGWRLSGTATLVLHGADADVLLVVATTPDGVGLFEAEDDVRREATPALDPTLRFATVHFDAAPGRALTTDAAAALTVVRDVAAVAVTALQVGAAQAALDRTVEHLRTRVQFGRPLGSFQALKHRVADLHVQVQSARSMFLAAAGAAAGSAADLPFRAACAKAWCTEAFSAVAAEMVQLHGGIAITWEHDAHLYFKHAHATAHLFGPAPEHRRRLLDHV